MEQEQKQGTYTQDLQEALKGVPEDKREVLAGHLYGIVEGVKIAQALEKKSA